MYTSQEKRDEEIEGEPPDEVQDFGVPRSTVSVALLEMIPDKKKLHARKSTNLSFLRIGAEGGPILPCRHRSRRPRRRRGYRNGWNPLWRGPGGSSSWPSVGKDIG